MAQKLLNFEGSQSQGFANIAFKFEFLPPGFKISIPCKETDFLQFLVLNQVRSIFSAAEKECPIFTTSSNWSKISTYIYTKLKP